mmetsp:Transcript_68926/g.183339  ORF Transcript_68926/g.183339 Transcript_68926/m.183339 type:complete len:217 (+) Transcript_68926:583-1233(+)
MRRLGRRSGPGSGTNTGATRTWPVPSETTLAWSGPTPGAASPPTARAASTATGRMGWSIASTARTATSWRATTLGTPATRRSCSPPAWSSSRAASASSASATRSWRRSGWRRRRRRATPGRRFPSRTSPRPPRTVRRGRSGRSGEGRSMQRSRPTARAQLGPRSLPGSTPSLWRSTRSGPRRRAPPRRAEAAKARARAGSSWAGATGASSCAPART